MLCLEAQLCLNSRPGHLRLPSSTLVGKQWHEASDCFRRSVVGICCLEGFLMQSIIVRDTSSPHGIPRPLQSTCNLSPITENSQTQLRPTQSDTGTRNLCFPKL